MPETFLPTEGTPNDTVQFDSEEIATVLNSVNFDISVTPATYSLETKILHYIDSLFDSYNSAKEQWYAAINTAISYGNNEDSVPNPQDLDNIDEFSDEENYATSQTQKEGQQRTATFERSQSKEGKILEEKRFSDEENYAANQAQKDKQTESQDTGNSKLSAEVYKVTTKGGNLNVRVGAGTDKQISASIKNGTELKVKSIEGDWAQVEYQDANGNTQTGYVHTDYISKTKGNISTSIEQTHHEINEEPPIVPGEANSTSSYESWSVSTPQGGNLNLRTGADISSGIAASIKNGTELKVKSIEGNWAQVEYQDNNGNNLTGYVYKDYLIKKD